jgi:hypothetical protein
MRNLALWGLRVKGLAGMSSLQFVEILGFRGLGCGGMLSLHSIKISVDSIFDFQSLRMMM